MNLNPGGVTATTAKLDELLMKDGPWELRAHSTKTYKLQSYIAHPCPGSETKYYWYSLDLIDTVCHACGEYPSETIMGLWKLHNMDYIQAGVSH